MRPKLKISKANKADEIGLKFEKGKKLCEEGGLLCSEAKEEAIILAGGDKDKAIQKGSVHGMLFDVGFYTRGGTPAFDEELFKDLYPKLYAKCLVTTTRFDPEMLKTLVKKKVVSEIQFNAAVVRPAGSRVVDIKRFKQ